MDRSVVYLKKVTMFSGSVIYDLDVYFNLDFGSMFNLDLIPKFGS